MQALVYVVPLQPQTGLGVASQKAGKVMQLPAVLSMPHVWSLGNAQ
jgi:hypothetical protein